ncbi:MAG TPA: MATE family efflux transporter [Candidatus Eisenbergiella intestinipullorum]|nr:MATE family efflux transporter [Candidatus Eisenbergiella intestinipullorum]
MTKEEKKTRTLDMTQGSPGRLILSFALPLMLGNVFQQLYTFVDTLVVGQALGVNALAALGASEWLTFLMFGSVQGLTQGFSVILSQKFGAGQEGELRRAVFQAALLSGVAAVLLTGLGQAALPVILAWLGTPEEIRGMTLLYLRFIYAGIPAAILYNTAAAILRAVGDSRTPLRAMTASSLCNIVLDVLFVLGLGWGIPGAAGATVIAQLLSGVYCLAGIRRIPGLRLRREDCRANRELVVQEIRLGLPLCLQNMITSFGGLVVQSVINGFGVLFIAGYTAANKLYGLLEIAASSYGYAMSSYAGQNMGAGKRERIGAGLRAANLIGTATAYLMSAVMVLFGKPILSCFLTGDAATVEAALAIGFRFLCVLAIFFSLLYILYIIRACVQGMGDGVFPMLSSAAQLIMRVGCALLLTRLIGESGVFFGEVMAWAGADLLLAGRYFYLETKAPKSLQKKQAELQSSHTAE